jgi:hypothetical protein
VKARRWWLVGTGVVLALSLRLCYLVIWYEGGAGSVRRPHIESAALLLALVGFATRFLTDARGSTTGSAATPPLLIWVALVAAAFALYWPALHIGLLSDDFILIQHAAAWDVSQVAPQLFRPLPIFVWAIVVHLGGGAAALHILNILLHATNAYLASRIVIAWARSALWSACSALLVVAAPLGPEAVAWCSGTFDLFAAAWLMGAVLISRRADAAPWTRILLVACAALALLSKETSVVLPLLILIDAWARGVISRRVWVDFGLTGALVVIFAAFRLQSGGAIGTFSRYRIQRLLFDSFGSLAVPWHTELTASSPLLRSTVAVLVIALLTMFFVFRGPRWRSRAALGGVVWVLISVLPLVTMFYVGPQLQGARYLYLAACGWAALLVTAAGELSDAGSGARTAAMLVVVSVLGAATLGVRAHLAPWTHAASVRDVVLRAAAADERLHSCPVVYLQGLPASVDGAYLFANGTREALTQVGVDAFVRDEAGACSFRWNAAAGRFVPSRSIP